mmetsp:Transcript_123611/g.308888  ORF Transcript_123611/g.308888 Transcript_123611/m.308888 type:complete len:211 (+) Transcript_123611:429-1061(+)
MCAHISEYEVAAAGQYHEAGVVAFCEDRVQQRSKRSPGTVQEVAREARHVEHGACARRHAEGVAAWPSVAAPLLRDHGLRGALAVPEHRGVLVQLEQAQHDDEPMLPEDLKCELLPTIVLATRAELLDLQRRRRRPRRWLRPRSCTRASLLPVVLGLDQRQPLGQPWRLRCLSTKQRDEELRPEKGSFEVIVVRFVLLGAGSGVMGLWVE